MPSSSMWILIVLIVPLAVRSELLEEACHISASFSACEEWGYPTGGMWNNDGDCCACQGTQRCEDGYQLAVGLTHGDCHEPAAETACQVQTTCCIPDEGDGGRQYYRSDSTVSSRHDAVMYCGGEDQLARIESAAENARAQTACGSRMCWIGLRDSANIGKWSWPSSETYTYVEHEGVYCRGPDWEGCEALSNYWDGTNTVGECQASCDATETCVAFDINSHVGGDYGCCLHHTVYDEDELSDCCPWDGSCWEKIGADPDDRTNLPLYTNWNEDYQQPGNDYEVERGTILNAGDVNVYDGTWFDAPDGDYAYALCNTDPDPAPAPKKKSSASGASLGLIIGGVIGGFAVLALVVVGGVFIAMKSRKPAAQPAPSEPAPVVFATIAEPTHTKEIQLQQAEPPKAKFDPYTGAPIPKFDPYTGKQNY